MRTLITADLHLSSTSRDSYRVDNLYTLYDRAQSADIKQTIILGDLTEMKDNHSAWLVNTVTDIVRSFASMGPVFILQGNHDFADDAKCPFFGFLRYVKNVYWFGGGTTYRRDDLGLGRTVWLPYTRAWEAQWGLADIPRGRHTIFAHGMFNRTKLGNGREAENAMPLSLVPKNAKCYAGDVHIPQVLERVEYVGAPYTIDFGDDYAARAIVLDDKGGREDIDMSKLPQKRLVHITSAGPQTTHCNKGDILRVRVPMLRSEAAGWPAMRDKCRTWLEKRGFVVHEVVPLIDLDPGARVRAGKPYDEKSDKQVFGEYVRRRKIDTATRKQGEKLL